MTYTSFLAIIFPHYRGFILQGKACGWVLKLMGRERNLLRERHISTKGLQGAGYVPPAIDKVRHIIGVGVGDSPIGERVERG